jgi:ubiquitin-protein ligase
VWHGVIFCRAGKYRKGVFKFKMDLSAYPSAAPRIFFTSSVFNPLVHPTTGELDLSVQFPAWDSSMHFLALALAYIKTVFYNAHYWDTRSKHEAFNKEAARMWETSKDGFDARVKQCVRDSLSRLYINEPGCSIVFRQPEPAHQLVFSRILKSADEQKEASFDFADWFSDGVRNLASFTPQQLQQLPGTPTVMTREQMQEHERRKALEEASTPSAAAQGEPSVRKALLPDLIEADHAPPPPQPPPTPPPSEAKTD